MRKLSQTDKKIFIKFHLRLRLEQAFILPLTKNSLFGELSLNDADRKSQALFWEPVLDKLRSRKMSWEQFFTYFPHGASSLKTHPAALLAGDKKGRSLLHIAVLQERLDIVKELAGEGKLRLKKDRFGLTPLDLALFLDQRKAAALLGAASSVSFAKQPNIVIQQEEIVSKLRYLPYPIFSNDQLLDDVLERAQKAKLNDAISPEKIWMGVYFDKEIASGLIPKLSIQKIDEEVGFGVFAQQRIPPCSFVGEYTGLVMERKKRHLRDKNYCVRYAHWQMSRKHYIIDAEEAGNYTRFINHSVKPNIGLQSVYCRGIPRMIFISLKEIAKGTQLTFDYGPFFWKESRQVPKDFV